VRLEERRAEVRVSQLREETVSLLRYALLRFFGAMTALGALGVLVVSLFFEEPG